MKTEGKHEPYSRSPSAAFGGATTSIRQLPSPSAQSARKGEGVAAKCLRSGPELRRMGVIELDNPPGMPGNLDLAVDMHAHQDAESQHHGQHGAAAIGQKRHGNAH